MSTLRVIDYLDEFVAALKAQLVEDEKRWGDTWLKRTRKGQTARMIPWLNDCFDRHEHGGVPVPWLRVAGGALINWIREEHPELSPSWTAPDTEGG